MALFKCKMCGGALEINDNETVATCEYCGTQQTLPKLDNDRRANLYDRANHFRRNNEFDKAMGIYEQILNEDNTDAEAYWSLVLCRYGIEYVEDPATHKRVPTVNRAQFTSVFDDDNYKSALQYADGYQRTIYEHEAQTINDIQKGILVISQKEEPFDIFICYKETDNNGRRTQDSVLAQELYYQLTQEGFKVFFSRITLEDKLGSAYEPYIFAALNSAKVMVVLGTRSEYFNAVWVKNEWSRYLALIKNGAKKMLIPAYKDMDPYDLPEEFSHLQAQDMSKLGFMQDLIRGIKKITQADEPKVAVVKETVVTATGSVAPLLKRAFMFLEDGDWESANEYCEKVLDMDPENAYAYLGKLMAALRVKTQENLKHCGEPFDQNNNYQKAFRFADEDLKMLLTGAIDFVYARKKAESYAATLSVMEQANTQEAYMKAAHLFEEFGEYKDAKQRVQKCLDLAEVCRKDAIYDSAIFIMNSAKFVDDYTVAARKLSLIQDWKDAGSKIAECDSKIEELNKLAEEQALKRQANWLMFKKRLKKNLLIGTPIVALLVVLILAFVLLWNDVIIPNSKYSDAVALMNAGKYTEAIDAFKALNGYRDSDDQIEKCKLCIMKNPQIGDIVYFGYYEQDNNTYDGFRWSLRTD